MTDRPMRLIRLDQDGQPMGEPVQIEGCVPWIIEPPLVVDETIELTLSDEWEITIPLFKIDRRLVALMINDPWFAVDWDRLVAPRSTWVLQWLAAPFFWLHRHWARQA